MKIVEKVKNRKSKKIKNQEQEKLMQEVEQERKKMREQIENEKKFDENLIRDLLDPTLEGITVPKEKEEVEYCESEHLL